MVDFHSHILPGVDDGSKSVEESLALIDMLYRQGVDTVAATPHFYADNESVDSFLKRREDAFLSIVPHLSKDSPTVLLGAEVSYYEGVSRLNGLERLRIGDSKLLLMEMPCARWSNSAVKELLMLSSNPAISLVIAHGERYLKLQSDETVNLLLQNDVLIQTNASMYLSFFDRKAAIKGLKNGVYHLLGSDCHNTSTRPPRIGEAFEHIQNKLGADFVNDMCAFAYSLINK